MNDAALPELGPDVAVIGMAGRFPGAPGTESLWELVRAGKSGVPLLTEEDRREAGVPEALWNDPHYVPARGKVAGVELFDAAFFGFTTREAQVTDPQQRLFLECCWEALEAAGYAPRAVPGRVGVFAGASSSSYLALLLGRPELLAAAGDVQVSIGNDPDFLATRVSYKLDLKGPSMTVQTACSTSLVAVHLACQSLLQHECDVALAGGVSIRLPQGAGYLHQPGGISSPDGRCRPFDAAAAGTVPGNGVGVVALKRLAEALRDGDLVRAVIRGSAVNNDGAAKVGFTAPGVDGQAQAIAEALAVADLTARDVTYVEAHGTGTALGDPVEVEALCRVFRKAGAGRGTCALGAVKSNLGHLDAAAGIAGLIKTVLALEHGVLPPTLHFQRPNPHLDLDAGPFFVPAQAQPWTTGGAPRRAGVSSFGIGGTNAHVILEQAPPRAAVPQEEQPELLVLSARTRSARERAAQQLAQHLAARHEDALADVAFTLAKSRAGFAQRRCVVAPSPSAAAAAWRGPAVEGTAEVPERPVVFLFPGQGAPCPGAGQTLLREEPVFRERVEQGLALLRREFDLDLRPAMFPEAPGLSLKDTALAQPAVFLGEVALAELWISWGIRPQAVFGHSVGEYAAACVAGVFSFEDGLRLVAERGRRMQELPRGGMLAVALPEARVRELAQDGLDVAAHNAPEQWVLSGPEAALEALERRLSAEGIVHRRLETSHAFHSRSMRPAAEGFRRTLERVARREPQVPMLCGRTGTWCTAAEATGAESWAASVVECVRFQEGMEVLAQDPRRLYLEVGPGAVLTRLAGGSRGSAFASFGAGDEATAGRATLLRRLGELWCAGAAVDWDRHFAAAPRRRVLLPTYPFERQRCWVDGPPAAEAPLPAAAAPAPPATAAPGLQALWRDVLGVPTVSETDDFFALGGTSLSALQLLARLRAEFSVDLSLPEFLERPTVAALAARLESPHVPAAPSPIVSLHARGRHPPLFCVHPVGGQVLCYANLARQLGADQPFHALQCPGVDGECEPLATVETLARHHLDALRPVQPSGPYRLAGWSYGGLVALEMARQLEDEGQRVCFLALLDTALPPAATSCPAAPPEEGALIEWFLRDLIFTGPRALALPAFASLEDGFAFGVQRGALPADFDLALGRVLYHVFRTNMLALWRYAPRRVAAPLTVVRAQERPAADGPFDVRLEHWERFTPVLHLVEVPGDHFTLLQGTGLAAALRAGLEAVRAAGPRAVSLEDSRP